MTRALRIFRCLAVAVAKAGSVAVLRPAVGTVMAEGLVDAAPGIANELWQALRRTPAAGGLLPGDVRAAWAEVAALEPAEAAALAAEAVGAESGVWTSEQRASAVAYLAEVPATLRQSLRRPEDLSGRTVPSYRGFERPEELAALLPRRLSQMKAGQVVHGLELVRLVGRGGYGEVWEAVPRGVPGADPVALKFCTDARARRQLLEHEAGVAARVMKCGHHPGIVRLLRMHLDDDVPSLEFEFVDGGDLGAVLRSIWADSEPLDVADTFELMRQVLEPFAFMHAASPAIVHRDAKLSNILIGHQGAVRVTDFGIGGLAFSGEDVAQSRRGVSLTPQYMQVARGAYTPHYASREQMQGADAHPTDDVYSLGVILYQMLTRRVDEGAPSGDWQDELAEVGLPTIAIEVLKRALARSRERRYPHAGEMLAAVERVCQALSPGGRQRSRSGAEARREAQPRVTPRGVPPRDAPRVPAQAAGPVTAERAEPLMTGIGLKMVYVGPREFLMGSPASELDRGKDERRHRVRLTRGFWIGEHGVTQRQWRDVMGTEPWRGMPNTRLGDFVAATHIDWPSATEFCARLTKREQAAGRVRGPYCYTLPSEAERELASRAGAQAAYCYGDDPGHLGQYAVHAGDRDGEFAHAVKTRTPNAFGLYDLHGNVFEWCADAADLVDRLVVTDTYRDDAEDPLCADGARRVVRGGGWNTPAGGCRSAFRVAGELGFSTAYLGFRPVLAARRDGPR